MTSVASAMIPRNTSLQVHRRSSPAWRRRRAAARLLVRLPPALDRGRECLALPIRGTRVPAVPPRSPSRAPRAPSRRASGASRRRTPGAISSATAAPVNRAEHECDENVPPPDPPLSFIAALCPGSLTVQKRLTLTFRYFFGILADVADERAQLVRGGIHIVIQLLVVQQLAGGSLPLLQVARQPYRRGPPAS